MASASKSKETYRPKQKKNFTVDGAEAEYISPIFETPVEYPYNWFHAEGNEGKKPPLRIKLSKSSNLELSRSWAYAVASGTSSTVYTAVEYLYHVFSKIEETTVTDWTSYGVTIPKGKVTPLSLLAISEEQEETAPAINNPVILPESDDVGLVIYLVGLFRVARTHERHQDVVARRISPLIRGCVSTSFTARITNNRVNGPLLVALSEMEMLLAALDMFLYRFPKNRFSKCRIGTIILRHMGFSALNDITYFTNLIGWSTESEALEWFMTPTSGEEMKQILLSKEEVRSPYSYLPYAMSLKMSNKSPYSASANPNIHFIVHVVGSLFGNKRSINAILFRNVEQIPSTINAAVIFLKSKYVTSSVLLPQMLRPNLMDKYREDIARRMKSHTLDNEESDDDYDEDKVSHAYEAALQYLDSDYKFNEQEIEAIRNAASKIEKPRKGSVGKWVKDNMIQLLPKTKQSAKF